MKRFVMMLIVIGLAAGIMLTGCGQKKAGSSQEAIETAEMTLKTYEEKVDYLVKQAQAFYNSKQFQDAVETAQYVVIALQSESEKAKQVLQKAQDALKAEFRKAADELEKKLGDVGKK